MKLYRLATYSTFGTLFILALWAAHPAGAATESSSETPNQERSARETVSTTSPTASTDLAEDDDSGPEPKFDLWDTEVYHVTADRRETPLHDVAQSIQVFTADDLRGRGVRDIADLQNFVPGLIATGGLPSLTLRGIGLDNDVLGPASDPGFAVHINSTYVTELGIALTGFMDLERIEILPGPQGTLYGRNSTGGALNLITKRAEIDEWGMTGDLEVSSFNQVRAESVINVPLVSEKLALRLAWLRVWRGKPFEVDGPNLDQNRAASGGIGGNNLRLSLRWVPTEDITTDFIVGWTRDKIAPSASKSFGNYPDYPAGQHPLFGGSPDYSGATPNSANPFRLQGNRRAQQRLEAVFAQLIVDWRFGAHRLTSTSNYQYFDFETQGDGDASDLDISHFSLEDRRYAWTQEFLLQSEYGGNFEWWFGANYQLDKDPGLRIQSTDLQANADAANFMIFDINTLQVLDICDGPCLFQPIPSTRPFVDIRSSTKTDVVGVFAHATWDIVEKVRLAGGVRYSYTRRDFNETSRFDVFGESLDFASDFCDAFGLTLSAPECFQTQIVPRTALVFPGSLPAVTDLENSAFYFELTGSKRVRSWNSVTGLARIEFRPAEGQLIYGSISSGERHGGFNFLELDAFNSEKIMAYEIGIKSEFYGAAFLTLAGYYYDYKDRFLVEVTRGRPITTNTDAFVAGAEMQLLLALSPQTFINFTLSYLHAEFASNFVSEDNSVGPDNPTGFDPTRPPGAQHGQFRPAEDIKGNPLPRSPRWSLALGFEHEFEFSFGTIKPRVDFFYQEELNYLRFDNPLDRQEAYHRTDLRLRLGLYDPAIWIEGFVQNIEDNQDVRTGVAGQNTRRVFGLRPPRVFGIRMGFEI